MKKVRWGLLSTALINRQVIPDIRMARDTELVAVASRDSEKARGYAKEFGIPNFFGSYQDMLSSGAIDAVYISLPNHLHAEWTVRSLEAGVHVLCEKPFATSLEEVDAMIGASRKTGKILAEAFMYRHHPQTSIVLDFIRKGGLGKLSHAWGTFTFMIKNDDDIRMKPEMGGGSLWDIGIYPLSMVQLFFGGPPASVFGMQRTGATGVEETFVGNMQYPGGEFAQFSSSFRSEFYTYFELTGSEGRMVLTRPFNKLDKNRHLYFYPNHGDRKELSVPRQNLYLGEIEDMNSAIRENTPTLLTLEETRDHMRTALALYESARVGKPVEL
jgi:predicted dehydrogenase